jgi:hypothetical protein
MTWPGSRFVACLSVALLGIGAQAAEAAVPIVDRVSGCRVFVPDTWAGSAVHWIGQCSAGTAAGVGVGVGVAVSFVDGAAKQKFFGRVMSGKMVQGVLEGDDGYRIMRFIDGEPVPTDDRNLIISAFRTAADAALAASERFKAEGNAASAQYYAHAAEQLANQMD